MRYNSKMGGMSFVGMSRYYSKTGGVSYDFFVVGTIDDAETVG